MVGGETRDICLRENRHPPAPPARQDQWIRGGHRTRFRPLLLGSKDVRRTAIEGTRKRVSIEQTRVDRKAMTREKGSKPLNSDDAVLFPFESSFLAYGNQGKLWGVFLPRRNGNRFVLYYMRI
ncbi:hypothetical protein BHM03_00032559 [Ensete ventricosum]|nr:hypothetical protein BHM03_00032559 [Ensete ventricosum]